MGKDISELASYMRATYMRFSTAAHGAGIPFMLVDTGRTPEQQKVNLLHHVSWTEHSRHLPQEPENKSEAFDVVPLSYIALKGWNPEGELWLKLGEIGEKLGLEWGGRWPLKVVDGKVISHPDPGHFQWKRFPMQAKTDPELSTA